MRIAFLFPCSYYDAQVKDVNFLKRSDILIFMHLSKESSCCYLINVWSFCLNIITQVMNEVRRNENLAKPL